MDVIIGGGITLAILLVIVVVIGILLFSGLRTSIFFTVKTQENVIVQRFGKFLRVATPGLNRKMPFIDSLSPPISLRIQQLEVNIETKTRDNVFVSIPVAVQYVIRETNVVDAYYRLSNPEQQIRAYVFDTVRSALSSLTLDTAFESKDDIALNVEKTLSSRMAEYGFNIVNTLVTDISPDPKVRDSMNSINAAQRDREAAQALAEADKIKRVTQAEAEAESKRLQGVGVAAQRKAIAVGIAEQYEMLRQAGIEETAEQLLLMTQYFDTMQEVARNGRSNVLFLPSNPGSLGSMGEEIRNALLMGHEAQNTREESAGEEQGRPVFPSRPAAAPPRQQRQAPPQRQAPRQQPPAQAQPPQQDRGVPPIGRGVPQNLRGAAQQIQNLRPPQG